MKNKHEGAIALCESVNEIFGRWPLWPWTVLGLIVAGGGVGLAIGPTLRGFGESGSAALGSAACAGYGMVAAAMLSLLPRLAKLALLQRNIIRRPTSVEDSWWPLKLLGPALLATPTLRRTPEEFRFAVDTAGGQTRSILSDRLWPVWVTAFVTPVLGLITAWQNGAKVQLRLPQGEDFATVFPVFLAQVSPPMVATVASSLALMVAIVVTDQWTKGLLQRWCGIVQSDDGDHPAVSAGFGRQEFIEPPEPVGPAPRPVAPVPPMISGATHHLDPDELNAIWKQSESRNS